MHRSACIVHFLYKIKVKGEWMPMSSAIRCSNIIFNKFWHYDLQLSGLEELTDKSLWDYIELAIIFGLEFA